ncbi:MAG TPA: hypothetical protein VEU08_18570, partial [Vicinamibacterales bacterium]|nr:hypothetical protein [Vicinamibacterales bacterium]
YPIGDVWGEGTPLEQRTTFDRRANNVVAKVTVLCGGARHLTAAADVTEGQSDAAISERLRRRCDVDLQRPRP